VTQPTDSLRARAAAGELVARDLKISYGVPPDLKHVVNGCSFTVERGKLTAMVGPSGCGKSTLIRLLAGFEQPDAGRILLDGDQVTQPGRDRLVLFQETALFPWMTTYENVLYGPRARGEVSRGTLDFAEQLLARVGLSAFRDKYPPQLSGGMQRRAELARALINQPKVMLLDEPFRGLDALTKELMWGYCAGLLHDPVEGGRSSLLVTSDIDEAVFLADRILIMSNLPTSVRAVLEVDLPRPRSLNDLTSDRAGELKARALRLLNEEASRSFRGTGSSSGRALA
jgi:NitT/TauT family transport system ATP-binding protein